MTTLRDHLRGHYEKQHLPPARMDALKTMLRRRRWWIPALAAGLLVAITLVVAATREPLDRKLAGEIVMNHRKALDPEFASASYEELRGLMKKLDFAIVESEHVHGMELLGARYCSLQSCIACQLKLRDTGGRIHTLYEVRAFPELGDGTVRLEGLDIRLWREGELLLGLASPR